MYTLAPHSIAQKSDKTGVHDNQINIHNFMNHMNLPTWYSWSITLRGHPPDTCICQSDHPLAYTLPLNSD